MTMLNILRMIIEFFKILATVSITYIAVLKIHEDFSAAPGNSLKNNIWEILIPAVIIAAIIMINKKPVSYKR